MSRPLAGGNLGRYPNETSPAGDEFVAALSRVGRAQAVLNYGIAVIWSASPVNKGIAPYYPESAVDRFTPGQRMVLASPPPEGLRECPKVPVYSEKSGTLWLKSDDALHRLSPLSYGQRVGSQIGIGTIPLNPALRKKLGQRERRRSIFHNTVGLLAMGAMLPVGITYSHDYINEHIYKPIPPAASATLKPGKTPTPSTPAQPTEPGGTGGSAEAFSLTVGNWNVFFKNDPKVVTNSVAVLMKRVNILTLQEATSFGRVIKKELGKVACESCEDDGSKYGMFPDADATRKQGSGNRIIWDKDKVTLLESHAKHAPSDPGHVRSMTWALFKINETGEEVWILNIHAPNAAQNGKGHPSNNRAQVRAYKRYMGAIVKVVDMLQRTGKSVVLDGDFNSDFKTDYEKEVVNYEVSNDTCLNDVFVCGNFGSRLKNGWAEVDLSGANSEITTHGKGRIIDQLLYRPGTDVEMRLKDFTIYANEDKKTGKVKRTDGAEGSDHKITEWVLEAIRTIEKGDVSPLTGELAGVNNFRDVGISTGLMKSGVLYRSAKLESMSPAAANQLAGSITDIIDLRTASVRKRSPDITVPGVKNTSLPVSSSSSAKSYIDHFVRNPTDRQRLGAAIRQIAEVDGNVLLHCTAGKDRTGWVVAMIQYSLGATDEQVMAEYLKSNDYDAPVNASWLRAGLVAAIKDYGSIANYIKNGLEVDDATVAKLRAKLANK